MANLNKLLVHVPSDLCDGFKTKYVTATTNRNTSYDNKVVFLEKTQEIFTKGKLYGTTFKEFDDLKKLVGEIPKGATSKDIVHYISEAIGNANYIKSVKKKDGETLIGVDTDKINKNVTIYSTQDLKDAVNKAKNAMQNVTILSYAISDGGEVTVEQARNALGLGGAAYKSEDYFATPSYVETTYNKVIGKNTDTKTAYTIYGTRAYAEYVASEAAQGVVAKLPGVKEGVGIRVSSNTVNGKTTYTVSTSASVWHYKGNKTTKEQLPTTGNTTGDVWSVGPADAAGSTLYAWDGDEWINIGGPNGVTDVDTETVSYGVGLGKNQDGTVKPVVTLGEVQDGNLKVITGGTAYTAIFEAKKACNSYVNTYVGNLNNSYTSKNGTYVHVKVDTKSGNVSYVGVTETNALKTAVTNANSAVQKIDGDSPYLSATKKGTTVKLDLDETEVFNYVSNNIWETYSA